MKCFRSVVLTVFLAASTAAASGCAPSARRSGVREQPAPANVSMRYNADTGEWEYAPLGPSQLKTDPSTGEWRSAPGEPAQQYEPLGENAGDGQKMPGDDTPRDVTQDASLP